MGGFLAGALVPKVLICPLNWGLGHATRCIPIIQNFLIRGIDVHIGSDGASLTLLQQQFPQCQFLNLPGYEIRYPQSGSMIPSLLWQSPKLLQAICYEKKIIAQWQQKHQAQLILSDNRFGCRAKGAYNIYMTHQMGIMPPNSMSWAKGIGARIHRPIMKPFDEIWIPDFAENGISGWLGHAWKDERCRFIGLLSRMSSQGSQEFSDLLMILSGPEPQRTLLEKKLLEQLHHRSATGERIVLVRGLPQGGTPLEQDGLIVFDHLPGDELAKWVRGARKLICRSGYSTLMDLAKLGAKAILIPTPGQTEQIYLAQESEKQKMAPWISQDHLQLDQLPKLEQYQGFGQYSDFDILDQTIDTLFDRKIL